MRNETEITSGPEQPAPQSRHLIGRLLDGFDRGFDRVIDALDRFIGDPTPEAQAYEDRIRRGQEYFLGGHIEERYGQVDEVPEALRFKPEGEPANYGSAPIRRLGDVDYRSLTKYPHGGD